MKAYLCWLILPMIGATALGAAAAPEPPELAPCATAPSGHRAPSIARAALPVCPGDTQLALSFEPNRGQADRRVRFLAHGSGYRVFVTADETVLALRGLPAGRRSGERQRPAVLRMRLLGANPTPRIEALDPLPGKTHYLHGSDPKQWHVNLPTYARVRVTAIYPGVDVIYYGDQRRIEYDFVLAPGADPGRITLGFAGCRSVALDARGDLLLHTPGGCIRQHRPIIYQEVGHARRRIIGAYVLKGKNQAGLRVGSHDPTKPLVIDPVLTYATYLGGTGTEGEVPHDIAADADGNLYVTGWTDAPDFPTARPFHAGYGGGRSDAFVTKLNAAGTAVVYSTYLGGSKADEAHGIAVGADGSAYVTGLTESTDFPTTATAVRPTRPDDGTDAFVARLNPAGSGLIYATYLGDQSYDAGSGIAVDAVGSACVTGKTFSSRFPRVRAFQESYAGGGDAFVTRISADGASLLHSSFLGGSADDAFGSGIRLALDASGNAYLAGTTVSRDFPTTPGSFQPLLPGGRSDGFVAKVDTSGGLVYATHLGGQGADGCAGVAVDGLGQACVTGETRSNDFPTTASAFQRASRQRQVADAFVTVLNPAGSGLAYSTLLGGTRSSAGQGIAAGDAGAVTVAGRTAAADFPLKNPLGAEAPGGGDVFVAKLDTAAAGDASLVYSTLFGGRDDDEVAGIALHATGKVHVVGWTRSADLPTTSQAPQREKAGEVDLFVASFAEGPSAPVPTALTVAPEIVPGCRSALGTVVLSRPAPAGGVRVTLQDALLSAHVPTEVTIPEKETQASFTITTRPVTMTTMERITASAGGVTRSAVLKVRPIGIESVTLASASVEVGQSVAGTATLECAAAPGPIPVSLSSSDPTVARPRVSSLTLSPGTVAETFAVDAVAAGTATIRATANGIPREVSVTVTSGQHLLACGEQASGSLDTFAEQDRFYFAGRQGDIVALVFAETGSGLDALAEVLAPSGQGVGGIDYGRLVLGPLSETGIYTIVVRHYSNLTQRGGYRLRLSWLHPIERQCNRADYICGQVIDSALETFAEEDTYTFTASQGNRLEIAFAETGSGLDALAEVLAPNGSVIGGLDYGRTQLGPLPETGTYTLVVRHYSIGGATRRGTYSARIECVAR